MDDKQQDHERSWISKRHEVFVRSARDASHQVLFFLGMLYTPNCTSFGKMVRGYWETALHQIMAIVRGVYIPSFPPDPSTDPEAPAPVDGQAPDELKRAVAIKAEWRKLRDSLSWDGAKERYPFEDEKIQALRDAVTRFLKNSRAPSKAQRILDHGLADFFRWGCRHIALLLAAALLVVLSLGVAAIKGLLWNEGWLKLLFYVVFLPLPFYIHWWINRRLGKGNKIFCLSIAFKPFWQLKPLAVGPGRMVQRWPDEPHPAPSILWAILLCQAIKFLAYFCLSLLCAGIIYWIQGLMGFAPAKITPCILVIFYLILLAANQIDFWDFIFYAPLRSIGLLLVGILLLGLWLGWGRPTFIGVLVGVGGILVMFHVVTRRWKKTLLGFGVLAVVLALFTTVAWHTNRERIWKSDREYQFQRLTVDKWPHISANPVVVMIASGGGSRAAVYTGLTLQHLNAEYPEIARQLQAISSVSGGSLANAAYLARLLADGDAGCSQASLTAMVESLADDFLLPTLVGALVPFQSRSAFIQRKWREGGVGLGDYSLKDLADRWKTSRPSDAPPFPIPLFNTTTLEANDLVISPLSADCYTNMGLHREARHLATNRYHCHAAAPGIDDPVTWVYYRHCVYGMENLLPKQNLPLSSAVLASANFPFGFPVVKVEPNEELERPLYFSPRPDPRPYPVKLTDGGVLSNSGMWSMFNLLVNKKADLVARGVLLIIVEASKMPSYSSMKNTINRLQGTISDQAPIGRNLHEVMFSYLDEIYGDRFATVQLDLTPRNSTNIMTTWALDNTSLKTLETDFSQAWCDKRARIGELWEYLKSKGKTDATFGERIERERLPLD